jgi:MscS family membrane protein
MDTNLIIGLILIFAGIIMGALANRINKFLIAWTEKTDTKLDDLLIRSIGKPLVILAFTLPIIYSLDNYIPVPEEYQFILNPPYITVFYILIAAWVIATFLDNFILTYGHYISEKSGKAVDDRIIDLMEMGVKWIVYFVALLVILNTLKIDVTPLLASAGIAGIAAALAVKDILSNFLGGAMLVMDKPFQEKDRVQVDKFTGNILQVGTRSTRMMTSDNHIITIPNSILTTSVVINYSAPDPKMRLQLPIAISYNADIEYVRGVIIEIIGKCREEQDCILTEPAPSVLVSEFGESAIRLMMYIWISDVNKDLLVKDLVYRRIHAGFREKNIEIPYNQVDVHIRDGTCPE